MNAVEKQLKSQKEDVHIKELNDIFKQLMTLDSVKSAAEEELESAKARYKKAREDVERSLNEASRLGVRLPTEFIDRLRNWS